MIPYSKAIRFGLVRSHSRFTFGSDQFATPQCPETPPTCLQFCASEIAHCYREDLIITASLPPNTRLICAIIYLNPVTAASPSHQILRLMHTYCFASPMRLCLPPAPNPAVVKSQHWCFCSTKGAQMGKVSPARLSSSHRLSSVIYKLTLDPSRRCFMVPGCRARRDDQT